jgi:hypothetical protein
MTVWVGLRKRLLNLFLQFVETPTYNPEAKRLTTFHQDASYFKGNLARAAGTQQFMTTADFDVTPQLTTGAIQPILLPAGSHALLHALLGLGKSKAALRLANRAVNRQDNRVYRRMLEAARVDEQRAADQAQVSRYPPTRQLATKRSCMYCDSACC